MNRRRVLTGYTTALLFGLAGCTSDSALETTTTPPPADETTTLPAIDLSTTDATPESSDVQLEVRWRARVQRVLQSADSGGVPTHAEDGRKWLVVQLAATNTGGQAWDATPVPFVVDVGAERFEFVSTDDDQYFGGRKLASGESLSGYLVFQIPLAASTATLTVDQDLVADALAVVFEHDASLSFDIGT